MKKQYEKPSMSIDMFEANEYIAACYRIKCNVPSGKGYIEKNGITGYQQKGWQKIDGKWVNVEQSDSYIASGKGCGVWHVGVHLDAPPYENAMWDPDGNGGSDAYPVFHWSTGSWNHNQHFSKVSDAQWETNPNAS